MDITKYYIITVVRSEQQNWSDSNFKLLDLNPRHGKEQVYNILRKVNTALHPEDIF
jgi:hypothetical protein